MRNLLPALHDAHDRRLSLEVPICCDPFMSFFVLFLSLLELDSVDLDTVFRVAEGGVEGELVSGVDIPAFGMFC